MPQVVAWECPDTKELFRDKKDYDRHRREVRRDQQVVTKRLDDARSIGEAFRPLYAQTGLQGVVNWLEGNPDQLLRKARFVNQGTRIGHGGELELKIALRLGWVESLPLTHCAPFAVRQEHGWSIPANHPACPGWQGRIDYHVRGMDGFKLFEYTGIHTGTGGGHHGERPGFQAYGFDVVLFAQDFPCIPHGGGLARPNDWEWSFYGD